MSEKHKPECPAAPCRAMFDARYMKAPRCETHMIHSDVVPCRLYDAKGCTCNAPAPVVKDDLYHSTPTEQRVLHKALMASVEVVDAAPVPVPAAEREEAAKWHEGQSRFNREQAATQRARRNIARAADCTRMADYHDLAASALRGTVDDAKAKRIESILAYLPPEEGTDGLIDRLVDAGVLRVLNEDNANLYYTATATEDDWPNGWHLNPVAALAAALGGKE